MGASMSEEETITSVVPATKADFLKLADQFPDFCKPVFDDVIRQNEILEQISTQMPNAINVIQAANAADTYKTVDGVPLPKGDDGLYSPVLRDEDGKINQHVKLKKAASDAQRAACFTYSILNAAVGQANMMSIAERLAEIEIQLDEVKKRDYDQQVEDISSACSALNEVLCLSDDEHIQQMIIFFRYNLRKSLGVLRRYVIHEIESMPKYRKEKPLARFISNWGSENSTLPVLAKKRFDYVLQALPVWCEGMSFLVMTDPYVKKRDEKKIDFPSANEVIKGLREIFEESGLSDRVVYLQKMEKVDPIELVQKFRQRIPELEKDFNRMRDEMSSKRIKVQLLRT